MRKVINVDVVDPTLVELLNGEGYITKLLVEVAKVKNTSGKVGNDEIIALGQVFDALMNVDELEYVLPNGISLNDYRVADQFKGLVGPSAVKFDAGFQYNDLIDYDWTRVVYQHPKELITPKEFEELQALYLSLYRKQNIENVERVPDLRQTISIKDMDMIGGTGGNIVTNEEAWTKKVYLPLKLVVSDDLFKTHMFAYPHGEAFNTNVLQFRASLYI